MQRFELDRGDEIPYVYRPAEAGRYTFVTFNALTQSYGAWDAVVERWHAAGHGSLRFDICGQPGTTPTPGIRLDVARIVSDARQLLAHVGAPRPIMVGLSIGGLFAARTVLDGATASALVLINTLRRDGVRLAWINEAVVRALEVGGPALVRDLYAPLLMSDSALETLRPEAFGDDAYVPLGEGSALLRLVRDCSHADWDVPYEVLTLPVLVVTGLRDRVFYEARDVNELVLRMPDPHRVDLPEAGHLVPLEQPGELAEAVLDFVSTL